MPLLFHLLLVAVSLAASDGEPIGTAGDTYNASMCPTSLTCGDGVDIHYPFYLSDESEVTSGTAYFYCGYPGMAIACVRGHPVLHLNNDSYNVLNIDYGNNTISLADTDALDGGSCPRVRHNVTIPPPLGLLMKLSSSATDYLAFFFNCTFTSANPPPLGIEPINCTGFDRGTGLSYALPQPDVPPGGWPRACKEAYVVPVLRDSLWRAVHNYSQFGKGGYGAVLKQGFQLTWDPSPGPCFECEQSMGQCSFNQTGGFLGCLCSDGRVRNPDCGKSLSPANIFTLRKAIYFTSTLFGSNFRSTLLHNCIAVCQIPLFWEFWMIGMHAHLVEVHTAGIYPSHISLLLVHQALKLFEQMHCLHVLPLLFILLLSSVPPSKAQSDVYLRYSSCTPTPYQCGSVKFDIDYPFSVNGVNRPDYCSYPGYRLFCTNGTLVIYMNSAGFQVTNVDYDNHILTVIDQNLAQETCLQHYRNTTINDSMFMYTDRDQFLTVYINCSGKSLSLPLVYDLFSCLSGGRSYYRVDNGTLAPDVQGVCSSTLVVPYNSAMAGSLAIGNSSLGDAINGGFTVRWKVGMGWCGDCKHSGGLCGYTVSSPNDQTCYCPDEQAIGSCSSGLKKPGKRAIVIATSVAAGVLFLLLVVVSFLYIRKRRQYKMTSSSRLLRYTASGGTPRSRGSSDMQSGSVRNLQTHHFAYEELEEATEGFSGTRELGDGGFGTVYKGHLRDGRVVAVKRLYSNSCRHVEQFLNEAAILSRLRHPNLVTFYGCTSSRSRELLLVYEFVPNGTVADHLHGHRAPERALTWPLRLNIAVEAAAALAYLHAVEPPIVHRDVKTNNILLDADFHVKVADFGLSRLFPLDVTHVSTAPQGTPGYVDPEYHQCYQLTDKSDVYSFGVVLVELISSKPAIDVTRDRNEINLAGMAINKIQRCQVDQLVDLELGYDSDQATRKMMTMVAELAFQCLQQNGEMRPPIREVLDVLTGIQDGCRAVKDGKKDVLVAPHSPDTVHAPWDSMSTTPSISQ